MARLIVVPDSGEMDADTKRILREQLEAGEGCRWCGGLHQRECPRLKKVTYHPTDGSQVRDVEFWSDSEWDKSSIIFPEDLT